MLSRPQKLAQVFIRYASIKEKLKNYSFPEIRNEDCWGPGGQKVNTAQNAVQLRHIPTGIVLKVHESRLLPKNIEIAFERMKHAVDRHYNGDNCYEEQLKRLQKEKEKKTNARREKQRQLREEYAKEAETANHLNKE